ncbi:tetratricopeptide repeat protein [Sandaracinus amylolyticus]|uniref:tetratricopeptide repeat protein n=1 Tax=Sandaracinus amylolyticus TaxID=927083 RepID=UPI001F3C3013|nr:tetratricopeptide repeat protein [Sandaracinus amylolyticus]UJR78258.1 TPR repeat-containing protein YrrB [Sandaracinus amylolyticus]
MSQRDPVGGKIIHVQFGPGGGRRAIPASSTPPKSAPTTPVPPPAEPIAAPAPDEETLAADVAAREAELEKQARRRDPTGDLYGRAEVARLFGIPESKLRYWDRTGFLSPSGVVGARRLYTFQDLIGVRTAKTLLERGVPLRRVRKTVDALRTTLPDVVRPLSELRVLTDGQSVIVRDEKSSFEPRTGQVVMDFEVRELRDDVVRVLRPDALDPARRRAAYEAYLEGCRLDEDESTLDRAEACYRRAISLDPALANALTNLGNLRFRRGDGKEARGLYERAIELDPEQPEAWYNLGFLAFERSELEEAVRLFDRAVSSDPSFADAHFNLAMALEEIGRTREARVHWETYLKLDPSGPWAEIAKRHL